MHRRCYNCIKLESRLADMEKRARAGAALAANNASAVFDVERRGLELAASYIEAHPGADAVAAARMARAIRALGGAK